MDPVETNREYNLREKALRRAQIEAGLVISQTISLISSALILVAALAWNETIKAFIDAYFKTSSGLISRLIYALVVTAFAAIVTMRLNRLVQKFNTNQNQSSETK